MNGQNPPESKACEAIRRSERTYTLPAQAAGPRFTCGPPIKIVSHKASQPVGIAARNGKNCRNIFRFVSLFVIGSACSNNDQGHLRRDRIHSYHIECFKGATQVLEMDISIGNSSFVSLFRPLSHSCPDIVLSLIEQFSSLSLIFLLGQKILLLK